VLCNIDTEVIFPRQGFLYDSKALLVPLRARAAVLKSAFN